MCGPPPRPGVEPPLPGTPPPADGDWPAEPAGWGGRVAASVTKKHCWQLAHVLRVCACVCVCVYVCVRA